MSRPRTLLTGAAVTIIGLLSVVAGAQRIASNSPVADQHLLKPEPPNGHQAFGPHALLMEFVPTIMAGESGGRLGDSPAMRVDPNTRTSPFAGVGSLLLHFPQGFFLCSGSAITRRHILTAAHCVTDEIANQALAPQDVTFVLNVGGDETHRIPGQAINIYPGFIGTFDFRFDLAVVTLGQDLPAEVPTYDLLREPLPLRTIVTMVGYGHTGDGHTGIDYNIPLSLSVKRSGKQVIDFIGGPGRPNENLFFYDFDAPNGQGLNVLGGLSLGNQIETSPAFGDSGGPSFVTATDGSLLVAGLNNFGIHFHAAYQALSRESTFGEGGGGVTIPASAAWIDSVTGRSRGIVQAVFAVDASDTSTALISDLDRNYDIFFLVRSLSGRCMRIGAAPCIDIDRETNADRNFKSHKTPSAGRGPERLVGRGK